MTEARHRNYLRTPTDMADELLALSRTLQETQALAPLDLGIPEIDKRLLTLWGGTLTSIVARPSHLKSFTLKHMAKRRMMHLIETGQTNRVVMYVTMEESHKRVYMELNRFATSYMSLLQREADYPAFEDEAIGGGHLTGPLWIITDQPSERPGSLQHAPRFTVEQLYREIDQAVTDFAGRKVPDCLFVDYVQLFRTDTQHADDQRIFTVMASIHELRTIGRLLDIPVVMAVQAGRYVEDKNVPIPDMRSGEWASAIEQYSDVMLATAVPARWPYSKIRNGVHLAGIDWTGQELTSEHLCVVTLLKQRMYQGVGQWMVYVDYDKGLLLPYSHLELGEDFMT